MSTDLLSLWGAIQRGNTREIASHIIPPSTDTARKSCMTSQGQKDATAGLGSVEAGPIVRYWTVKFERGGRTHFTAVEACDVLKATLVVFKRHEGANGVQVVREIQRDEFEALTRGSP
jgi:hypothetical protein